MSMLRQVVRKYPLYLQAVHCHLIQATVFSGTLDVKVHCSKDNEPVGISDIRELISQ